MPAPIAKGLIIFASILTAAGIALYEDPYIRQWIDAQRRKLAVALHTLGDELDTPSSDPDIAEAQRRSMQTAQEEQARRQRREEIVKRNRNELVRAAREDGIAIDLDELAKISNETEDEASIRLVKTLSARDRSDKNRSFDELVGSDGILRGESTAAEASSAGDNGLRHRGAGARGLTSGSAFANPFADEEMLFDHDRMHSTGGAGEGRQSLHDSLYSLDTLDAQSEEPRPLIDVSAGPDTSTSAPEMTMLDAPSSVHSFYSLPPSPSTLSHHSLIPDDDDNDDDDVLTPSGTLTPVENGFSTAASMVGSHADDVGNVDLLSDTLSESDFSHISGAQTPSSWTDVGSDDGSIEEQHPNQP